MPELSLGIKHECFSCGTRFYDLGKPEALCPKCGANQKDSNRAEATGSSPAARKRRKVEPVKPIEIEEEEPIEEIADDDIVVAADVELDEAEEEEEEEEFDEA